MKRAHLILACTVLAGACGPRPIEVDHPFYLDYFEHAEQMALFRCPDGPREGCAIDGLPDATVFAAGADERYVVVARHPRLNDRTDWGKTEYFYFARVPEETRGWGNNPERIVGPLTEAQFESAKRRLRLPDFKVKLG